MSPALACARLALIAFALLTPAAASAQPVRVQIHDPFYEGGHFTTKNLQLDGRGAQLERTHGGRVSASIDLNADCRDCGASVNQIIVGLAGEPSAQACVYSGMGRSGWSTARFTLDVPDRPGIYEVRARYAQGNSCADGIRWWRTDRPQGPNPDATIGVIVVTGDPVPMMPARPRRELRDIQRDMDDKLAKLDDLQAQILALSNRPANAARTRSIRDLTKRSIDLARELADLSDALADLAYPDGRPGDARPGRPGRRDDRPGRPDDRRPPPFDVVVVSGPPPGPMPMSQRDLNDLLGRIDAATFSDAQKNALQDTLNAGAYFDTAAALAIIGKFPHETHKVDVAAMLCPRIVEPGALPRLLGAFVFESYKQELRNRTNNQCGWTP